MLDLVRWTLMIGLAPLALCLAWRQAVAVITGLIRLSGNARFDPARVAAFHTTLGGDRFRGEGRQTWSRHPREIIEGSHR